MDRWKWVVIDVGVILDTSASHSENFVFSTFLKSEQKTYTYGSPPPYTPIPHPPYTTGGDLKVSPLPKAFFCHACAATTCLASLSPTRNDTLAKKTQKNTMKTNKKSLRFDFGQIMEAFQQHRRAATRVTNRVLYCILPGIAYFS